MTASQRRYYERNKAKVIAKAKECATRDPEGKRAYLAAYYQNVKSELKEKQSNWRKANPHKVRAQIAKRRAAKLNLAVPLTNEERAQVIGAYAIARAMSELSGEPYHVDH